MNSPEVLNAEQGNALPKQPPDIKKAYHAEKKRVRNEMTRRRLMRVMPIPMRPLTQALQAQSPPTRAHAEYIPHVLEFDN